MSLAREINQKLDEILSIQAEMETLKSEVGEDSNLTNVATGDTMSRNDALKCAQGAIERIESDLNKLTNQGRNVRDLFTNPFYINDMVQDKKIANGLKESKLQKENNEIKRKPEINISEIRPSQRGNQVSQEEFMKKWQEWMDRNKEDNS